MSGAIKLTSSSLSSLYQSGEQSSMPALSSNSDQSALLEQLKSILSELSSAAQQNANPLQSLSGQMTGTEGVPLESQSQMPFGVGPGLGQANSETEGAAQQNANPLQSLSGQMTGTEGVPLESQSQIPSGIDLGVGPIDLYKTAMTGAQNLHQEAHEDHLMGDNADAAKLNGEAAKEAERAAGYARNSGNAGEEAASFETASRYAGYAADRAADVGSANISAGDTSGGIAAFEQSFDYSNEARKDKSSSEIAAF